MDAFHNLLYRIAGVPLHGGPLRPAIPNKPRIMDVGCGTGFWAVSIAEYVVLIALALTFGCKADSVSRSDYPEAEVLGLDLANIQPAQ